MFLVIDASTDVQVIFSPIALQSLSLLPDVHVDPFRTSSPCHDTKYEAISSTWGEAIRLQSDGLTNEVPELVKGTKPVFLLREEISEVDPLLRDPNVSYGSREKAKNSVTNSLQSLSWSISSKTDMSTITMLSQKGGALSVPQFPWASTSSDTFVDLFEVRAAREQ